MSRAEMDQENEQLKGQLELYTRARYEQDVLEMSIKAALDSAKNAASNSVDKNGKPPSEAYCTRVAEADTTYLKLRENSIEVAAKVRMAADRVEYQRNRVKIAVAAFEVLKG